MKSIAAVIAALAIFFIMYGCTTGPESESTPETSSGVAQEGGIVEVEEAYLNGNRIVFAQSSLSIPPGWTVRTPLDDDEEGILFRFYDGDGAIQLSYVVRSCGWSPAYTFRSGADRKDVGVECSGLIHQMTGEDWTGVKLTLTTASPSLSACGPGLALP